jgi:hypothetical protein
MTKEYHCRKCGCYIWFDNWHIAKSGKKIPLELDVGGFKPHTCQHQHQHQHQSQNHGSPED